MEGTTAAYATLVPLASLLTLRVRPSQAGSCVFGVFLGALGQGPDFYMLVCTRQLIQKLLNALLGAAS